MELGEKLRQARQEAGLSQRQLCGDTVTRNMLSQIENGSARPSMDTLRILAGRLGKSLSYFLEEDAVTSPNRALIQDARQALRQEDHRKLLEFLEDYRGPDALFDEECRLLQALGHLALGKQATEDRRLPYARELLTRAGEYGRACVYWTAPLERQLQLLLWEAGAAAFPESDDRELLIRGQAALEAGDPARAGQILDAAEHRDAPRWNLLRGNCYFAAQNYREAAKCYARAENDYPGQVLPRLEICYRELGDYRKAYEYACKQK